MENAAAANVNIMLTNSAIFKASDLELVKDFKDGHKAFANGSKTAVAIFVEMEDGHLFNVSRWRKHKDKSLLEIAEGLYGRSSN